MKGLVIAAVALVVVGGGVFGAAKMGLVKIPGISPPPPKKKEEKPQAKPPAKPKAAPKSLARATPVADGPPPEKKVAQLWNEIPAERVVLLAAEYQDAELARVLLHMDGERAAQVLAGLEPKRAAAVSRLVGRASVQ